MIKNVVFDMGNVLLRYDPELPLNAFCHSEAEKDLIRRELFQGPEWVQGDLGTIEDEDRFELIKKRVSPKHWEALQNCCEKWYRYMQPIEGAISFCERLRQRGYRLFVLSNASNAFHWFFPANVPKEYFEGIVVSAEIHLLKPDREIYEYLLKRYGLKAEECLFLDDLPENVEGARAVGMNAMQFLGDYGPVETLLL